MRLLEHFALDLRTAESNLLKFKEMVGWIIEVENIKVQLAKSQKRKGFGENNQLAMIRNQIEVLSDNLRGIKEALSKE
jgi:hypothetical protein